MEDCPYLIGDLVLSHIMHIVKQNAIIGKYRPGGETPVEFRLSGSLKKRVKKYAPRNHDL